MPERDRTSQQQTQDDDRQKAIEQILEENRRWLPPSPHAEKMAEAVAAGRCHIQHRGHGQAPLLVFFDGGAMQLPTVRWANTARGWRFTAESSEHSPDQTTHLDVCGTVDTIEQAIEGEPQLEGLDDLCEDIKHMLGRLARRQGEYDSFVSQVREALEWEVRSKPVEGGLQQLEQLREMLARSPQWVAEHREQVVETAEAVRDVAQYLEYCLTDYKKIALRLHELYEQVRGARKWDDAEAVDA
jgi:DNA repair exonuclease SbcCD ATPase subunit